MNILKLKKIKYTTKYSRGFTVLETMIAILIIAAVIGGISSAVRTGLLALSYSKEDTKAFYLAQEAIEMIRNRRDSNQLDSLNGGSSTWLTGLAENPTDPCYLGKTCRVDTSYAPTDPNAFTTCTNSQTWGTCPVLNQNSTTYLNSYTSGAGWVSTGYDREVQIESFAGGGGGNQVMITVLINWMHGTTNRSLKIKTMITNWF